jgi:hypothetical protein
MSFLLCDAYDRSLRHLMRQWQGEDHVKCGREISGGALSRTEEPAIPISRLPYNCG